MSLLPHRSLCVRWLARLGLWAARLLVKLPSWMLVRFLGLSAWIFGWLAPGHLAALASADLHRLVKHDPRGLAALRGIALESRPALLTATLEGVLRHHVLPVRDAILPTPMPQARRRRRPAAVAVLGQGVEAALVSAALDQRPDLMRIETDPDRPVGPGNLPATLDAVELVDPALFKESFIYALLKRGTAVSVHQGAVRGAALLRRCWILAEELGTPFRVVCPALYHPPVVQAFKVLQEGQLGEVGSIRVRAIIGGPGGRFASEPPVEMGYLRHPAFDQFPLLTQLGGHVGRVTAYLNPMLRGAGGQGLVSCEFTAPGCLGLLECAWAPDMTVHSNCRPYLVEVEIAGSDGILWLNTGPGRLGERPALRLRVGRREAAIGAGAGLDQRWESSFEAACHELSLLLRGKVRTMLAPAAFVGAFRTRERAEEAAGNPSVLGA